MINLKLYSLHFPIWLILFFPPIILITLVGNFVINSIVIITCYQAYNLKNTKDIKTYYKKSILKVWAFGFIANFIGASFLYFVVTYGEKITLTREIINGINNDPFSNINSLIFIVFSMLVTSYLIYLLNYKITFKTLIEDAKIRFKVALTIAIFTTPLIFLIPSNLFY